MSTTYFCWFNKFSDQRVRTSIHLTSEQSIAIAVDEVEICSIFSTFSVWYFTPGLAVFMKNPLLLAPLEQLACARSWYNLWIFYIVISHMEFHYDHVFRMSRRKSIVCRPVWISKFRKVVVALPLVANHTTNVTDSKNACNNRAQFLAYLTSTNDDGQVSDDDATNETSSIGSTSQR